jgi:transcriptional regulator with XRE-family HTH domain
MKVFGERLKRLRVNEKMTQKQLAEKLKISESAVGMYERSEREPSFEIVLALSEIFDVTTDYLHGKPDGTQTKISKHDKGFNSAFYDFENLSDQEVLELQEKIFEEWKKRTKKDVKEK